MLDTMGKAAPFMHGQRFLYQRAGEVVHLDFCCATSQQLTQGAEGLLAASKVAIRIVKGSNRSARGECEDAGCTLASSEHQRPAQTEGGRISEHDLEHFGTTAPNLEHFPAWPIQHLAPFSSGHDGV